MTPDSVAIHKIVLRVIKTINVNLIQPNQTKPKPVELNLILPNQKIVKVPPGHEGKLPHLGVWRSGCNWNQATFPLSEGGDLFQEPPSPP